MWLLKFRLIEIKCKTGASCPISPIRLHVGQRSYRTFHSVGTHPSRPFADLSLWPLRNSLPLFPAIESTRWLRAPRPGSRARGARGPGEPAGGTARYKGTICAGRPGPAQPAREAEGAHGGPEAAHRRGDHQQAQGGPEVRAHCDAMEAELKRSTAGLLTLHDVKARLEALARQREMQRVRRERRRRWQLDARRGRECQREQRRRICGLSFSPDDGDEDPEGGDPEGKDAAGDTSFLPDREREEVVATSSSWAGCGHRRAARIHRGGPWGRSSARR